MQQIGKCFAYSLALLTLIALTGCGGAGSTEDAPQTSNKSAESSSLKLVSSTSSSTPLSSAANSSLISKSPSSTPLSSSSVATSAYQRTSRISSSTPSIDEPDVTPPSKTKLFPYKFAISSLTITWDHATDDIGINAYKIERDGVLVATLEYPSFVYTDKGLTPNTNYTYTISAVDTSGNIAEESDTLNSRTLAVNGTTSSITKSSSSNTSNTNSSVKNSGISSKSSQQTSSKSSEITSSVDNQQTSSSSQSSTPTSSSAGSSEASSSSSSQSAVITLKWEHPTQRVNSEYLELDEIAGYELRRKNSLTQQVIFLVIEGNLQKEFTIFDPDQNEVIDIAVYDTEGRYSDFVRIYPK